MKNLGSVGKFPDLSAIFHAVAFGHEGLLITLQKSDPSKPDPHRTKIQRFTNKRLNYIDWNGVRYVQQNPNTNSAYAARARQGSRIVWVIRLRDNAYMGYVENGEAFMKEEFLPKKRTA